MGAAAVRLNPYCSGRWSRTSQACPGCNDLKAVLILIVVEDGLVLVATMANVTIDGVLILIVVEDGLVRRHPSHSNVCSPKS